MAIYNLFSIAGALGRCAEVRRENLPANVNQALAILRPQQAKVYPSYLRMILSSPIIKQQIRGLEAGAAQKNLNLEQVRGLQIPFVSRAQQPSVVEKLNCFDIYIQTLSSLANNIRIQKQGLMQQLLTGKIRVKV